MSQQAGSFAARLEQGLPAFDWPGQADWLPGLRQQGLTQFRQHGLPTRSVERWRYTRLDELERRTPRLVPAPEPDIESLPDPLLDRVLRISMIDGELAGISGDVPRGLRLLTLQEALSESSPVLEGLLGRLEISGRDSALSALNTASLRNGLVLTVEGGVDAGDVLVQWAASAGAGDYLANSRVCLLLAEGARLRLVEHYESTGGVASQFNGVTQADLAGSARLEHVRLQQESAEAILVTRTEVAQGAGSHYSYTGLDFGGGTVRHDVRAQLQAAGASCSLNGASLTSGRSHVDNHLDAEHLAGDCTSQQYFRAVLGDRSRVVFNGRVFVAEGADGTDARQSSGGLLLSPLAEIDSKPELEIYADEVVASHGATVGQIDPAQLFYLQSRGIDRDTARTLLTTAFCRSVIEHLDEGDLRTALEARLQACLGRAGVSSD